MDWSIRLKRFSGVRGSFPQSERAFYLGRFGVPSTPRREKPWRFRFEQFYILKRLFPNEREWSIALTVDVLFGSRRDGEKDELCQAHTIGMLSPRPRPPDHCSKNSRKAFETSSLVERL